MLLKEMTKSEVDAILKTKGDFVQLSLLENYLNLNPPLEMKKFAYEKIVLIYEKKNMYVEAAKIFGNLAVISVAFTERAKAYTKEAESYIRAGDFDRAEQSIKMATSNASSSEKPVIYLEIKNFYKNLAESYLKEGRKNNALKVYEKLIQMNIAESEKKEIREKLLGLYEKLGKLQEYYTLKRG